LSLAETLRVPARPLRWRGARIALAVSETQCARSSRRSASESSWMNVQRASGSCGGRQHEFNNGQMLPRQTRQPQPPTQQQQQIQPQKKEEEAASLRFGNAPGPIVGLLLISVVGVARIESPGVTPQGSFIGDLAKLCPFSAILFRSGFMERSYSDGVAS
jgi:hypothetical protein